ncbi:MAG: hypothetical protein JWL73_3196 [Actinomycetia bacterium]|nr:hypothetical protein [Actinomycetes bacterium]
MVLGLLAGITCGLAAAGVAGARRTDSVLPNFITAIKLPTAAVLANDPSFDARQRRAVAALPEVRRTYPFMVAIGAGATRPKGFDTTLIPTAPQSVQDLIGTLVAGRMPDSGKVDEVVVDQNARKRFGLDIGTTMVVGQRVSAADAASAPPGWIPQVPLASLNFQQTMHVVGIAKSESSDPSWTAGYGFWKKYGPRLAGFINLFADLRHGEQDLERFRNHVEGITGRPTNVESLSDLDGIRKARSVLAVESNGLLLFALAVLLGGGVLVGQALVRAVTAGAADLPTWRAMGADRALIVPALVIPTLVTALAAGVSAVLVAIAVSSRFPIGVGRQYDLSPGTHADWTILLAAMALAIVSIVGASWFTAWLRVTRNRSTVAPPSAAASWATRVGLPPALLVGSRLAVEPGRGRRAVPVRSAVIGAIAGVLGVVGCFTFRAGINDTIGSPERSGVVWDWTVASGAGAVAPKVVTALAKDPNVAGAVHARWNRAVRINGVTTPTFGTAPVKGGLSFVVIKGRAPRGPDEIAFAPVSMRHLGVKIGDRVKVGNGDRHILVVGEALLPATSHTDYDQSGWTTMAGLEAAVPPAGQQGADAFEDYLLLRMKPGVSTATAGKDLARFGNSNGGEGGDGGYYVVPAALPTAVVDLGHMRSLPLALGVFFGLLACATVAHALVTTVRRRKHDLAVLRAFGFTRRQARIAIAWQATLLAAAGLLIGIPLGIITGRLAWRWLAHSFPVVYVPPLALLAVLLVAPVALIVANLLAAGPAHAATRIRPAEALRTE